MSWKLFFFQLRSDNRDVFIKKTAMETKLMIHVNSTELIPFFASASLRVEPMTGLHQRERRTLFLMRRLVLNFGKQNSKESFVENQL